MNKGKQLWEWGKSLIIAFVIAIFINNFLLFTVSVSGSSMSPTLEHGDRLFVNKITLNFKEIKRGDIVVLPSPEGTESYVKRVIALEDETVEIKDGKVLVDGKEILEEYTEKDSYTETYVDNYWLVPKGHVFVLGDNRKEGASYDSREFGTVSTSLMKGKATFRYFPFNEGLGKVK